MSKCISFEIFRECKFNNDAIRTYFLGETLNYLETAMEYIPDGDYDRTATSARDYAIIQYELAR